MSYDPATLVVARIESRFAEIDDPDGVPEADQKSPFDLEKLEHSEPGRVVYRWMPGRYGSWKDDTSSPTDFLHSTEFRIYYECLDAVFTMKYGEAIG
jgi:hypothetical protein